MLLRYNASYDFHPSVAPWSYSGLAAAWSSRLLYVCRQTDPDCGDIFPMRWAQLGETKRRSYVKAQKHENSGEGQRYAARQVRILAR